MASLTEFQAIITQISCTEYRELYLKRGVKSELNVKQVEQKVRQSLLHIIRVGATKNVRRQSTHPQKSDQGRWKHHIAKEGN